MKKGCVLDSRLRGNDERDAGMTKERLGITYKEPKNNNKDPENNRGAQSNVIQK